MDDGLSELQALAPSDAFRIALPNFEGPLDLLLHLIREHRLDIFDIPIALVTEKYLEHLDRMREVNLDIAGEFLVMASTLAHIKSRMLLPRQEAAGVLQIEQEEQGDPRAELVKRLLEYQKYKAAAEQLIQQDILDRDVFPRQVVVEEIPLTDDEIGLAEISIYKLIEALDRVLKELAPKLQHNVVRERMSLTDVVRRLASTLRGSGRVSFFSLFEGARDKQQIIILFLAILQMCKLKLIQVRQEADLEDIILTPREGALEHLEAMEVDESEYK